MTVMAYKGAGDRDDRGNWRPLSLGNTIAKLYSGCLADRLARWGEDQGRISPEQKGFTSHDGCVEHHFVVQSAIDEARRTGSELGIAFLDIVNAFGVIPHTHIIGTLNAWRCGNSPVQSDALHHVRCARLPSSHLPGSNCSLHGLAHSQDNSTEETWSCRINR